MTNTEQAIAASAAGGDERLAYRGVFQRLFIRPEIGAMIGADHPQVVTLTDAVLGALIFRAGMLEVDTPGEEFATEMIALVDAVA